MRTMRRRQKLDGKVFSVYVVRGVHSGNMGELEFIRRYIPAGIFLTVGIEQYQFC